MYHITDTNVFLYFVSKCQNYICIPKNVFLMLYHYLGNNGDKGDKGDKGDAGM